MYGCVSWNFSARHVAKLKRLIRLQKPWLKITYEDLIAAGGKRKLRVLGDLTRTEDTKKGAPPHKKILSSEVADPDKPIRRRTLQINHQCSFVASLKALGINLDIWESDAQARNPWREQIRTEASKFFMHNWLKTRAEAKARRHKARAQPATRSSQRIATQLCQAEEDEAPTTAVVGQLNSEEDDDMGYIEEEDSDDEEYTAGNSDHENDKADEADDDYDYDSDDGRLEEDDDQSAKATSVAPRPELRRRRHVGRIR